ncbi:uncharacterized protein LOC116601956 [Nematostella vectensis]|uniref:uncharacterized protein LOC116601956 n=1 Tax=Nematostella vectensis TaxID=45351 RepID=UPI0020772012|nr:uncharacterized protein LOC116601956 [Nematostella vectensis]
MRAHTKFQETETVVRHNQLLSREFTARFLEFACFVTLKSLSSSFRITAKLIGHKTESRLKKKPCRSIIQMAARKMLMLLALTMLIASSSAGPLAYGICQTGCNAVWVTCVAAAGGVAGVSTGGAGVPAAVLACNAAQGVCMAACVAAGLSPTL